MNQEFYEKLYNQIKQAGRPIGECFADYPKDVLMQPDRWFEALALCEYAIDTCLDVQQTEEFFEWIFKGFNCNATVDLNAEEYAWYWSRVQDVIDKFIPVSPDALVEKGLQFFSARREYADQAKTLFYLSEGAARGSESARTVLGYYYYQGFCGVTDKEKGMELMDSAVSERGKARVAIYKGYIALSEDRKDETKQILATLDAQTADPFIRRLVNEQRAFLLEQSEEYDAAALLYEKVLDDLPSGFAMMRLGYMNYNGKLASSNKRVALQWVEKAFRFGRTDAVQGLFYLFYDSGEEWQDEEKAVAWLLKGFEYKDGYSTYQLAYLYLYTDKYKDTEKGLYYLDCGVKMKYVDAYICKAYLYYEGELLQKDISASINLLEQAVEQGSGRAAYRIATLYKDGDMNPLGEPDQVAALLWFEKAASLDEMSACEYAGRYYLNGVAGEVDLEKAKAWYEKGVSLGSSYCMVELGLMYDEGNGVEEDASKAFKFFSDAANSEYAYGQYLVGRCYKYGLGVNENPDEALVYFRKAADQKSMKAFAELGLCYEFGYGVEVDNVKALEYMKQAAEEGYDYAQYKLGYYYMYGMDGVPADIEEGFKWFTQAGENDYPHALIELGDYYLYDYGDKEEQSKAYPFYERAAQQGYVNDGLGLCLEYGYGVEVNEGEAFKYYLKAAEDGYIRAMYFTGLCYYLGTGVKVNNNEALRWFSDAAGNGHAGATYYKAKMLIAGEGCSQDLAEGIRLLREAAEEDEKNAQFELGNCYLVGKGIDENADLAMEWFEKAADNGHEQALKITGRRRRR